MGKLSEQLTIAAESCDVALAAIKGAHRIAITECPLATIALYDLIVKISEVENRMAQLADLSREGEE